MYLTKNPQPNFIAGEWVQSTTLLDNVDPATGVGFPSLHCGTVFGPRACHGKLCDREGSRTGPNGRDAAGQCVQGRRGS